MDEEKSEYIADLVEQGYTSGFEPTWSLTIQEDENDEETRSYEVARLIRAGYFSGFDPTWCLVIEEDQA